MCTSWYYWYDFLVLGIHGFEFMVFMVRIYGGVLKKRLLLGTSGTINVCIDIIVRAATRSCSGATPGGDERPPRHLHYINNNNIIIISIILLLLLIIIYVSLSLLLLVLLLFLCINMQAPANTIFSG